MSAKRTIEFAIFSALVRRGGRVRPDEAEEVAREITEEVTAPQYRWALREIGEGES
jgi:hypothetical protein